MGETLDELRAFIADRIREGFASVHEIVQDATHYTSETYGRDDLGPEVKRLTAAALAAHRVEQDAWEGLTDCDRLDGAFAALNARGIVARQDFSCCNNCGFDEIWDEIDREEERHPVEGYVFYHLQATERAIQTGGLLMAYGCIEESPEALERVANAVVTELRRAGLNAIWGGTAGHPIRVHGFIWRRRR
jgi:hypothetical protein